ncbi:MAG: hypothetical protein Tsb0020_44210 [Haliangiales bacterium]
MTSRPPPANQLLIRRRHLEANRRLIIGRSLAAAVVGAVPLPLIDEWLVNSVQRSTFRRIGEAHSVDLDDGALDALLNARPEEPNVPRMAFRMALMRILATTWRKLVLVIATASGVRTTARYFARATLFDHYCAKLHTGLGIDHDTGLTVRALIDQAVDDTPGGLGTQIFRRGLIAAARATVRAPAELADIATAGALRKLLERRSRSDEPALAIAHEVDSALEAQLAEEKSFLSRAVRAVEIQLSVQGNPYLDSLVDQFERLWHQRAAQ